MNTHSFIEERKRTSKLLQEERILEFFQVVLTNLEQQVILIQNSLDSSRDDETQLEKLFKTLDERNDYYSSVMRELLLRATFLSIDRIHLLMTKESIEALVERIERVAHRLDLVMLPEWVIQHLMEMTILLHKQLDVLIKWVDIQSRKSEELVKQIQNLENQADKKHRSFLKQLYSTTTITYQQFAQAEMLDQLLEDTIDQVEILGRRLHLILEEYKTALQPLPHYLG